MESYSYYSYLIATIAYSLLLLLAIAGIRKNPFPWLFIFAVLFSILWSGYITFTLQNKHFFTSDTLPFETLRNTAWFVFLGVLIAKQNYDSHYLAFLNASSLNYLVLLFILLIFNLEVSAELQDQFQELVGHDPRLIAHLIFSVFGLMMVENLFRNTDIEHRWAIKFLCLGLGVIFISDFIVYSKSLLFGSLDIQLWDSRGLINAMVVPLLAISVNRLQEEGIEITISRKIVFHTTIVTGTGLYLLAMSLAGYYIRDYGGNWGEIAQIFFVFLALLLLVILFTSGKIRALTKVYFSKHFFHYHYDYREEWIKLSKTIARQGSINELSGFIIQTLANLVDSSGGGIWLKNEQGDYYLSDESHLGFEPKQLIKATTAFIPFIQNNQWVIDFVEYNTAAEVYADLDLSIWDAENNNVWLIIPLFKQNEMVAFAVLTKARVQRQLNWEDHDLLKTVGMQLANALALNQASDELSRVRQFEAFNRLSAFIVHDLKNLVSQISLIVKNAEKHKRNPEFIDDSIETLRNVTDKMQHLVAQLKKGELKPDNAQNINLVNVIADVTMQQTGHIPPLITSTILDSCLIRGEKQKMTAVLGHLVQNAQEATTETGKVELQLTQDQEQAIIKIIDNGHGMDKTFINERLFKPFDTTKGNAGMGIGVYEARDYILKYSGQFDVASTPGVGTTFTIKFPLENRG
jgi:putative PEP-CTERM system histidine kinase